MKHSTSLLLSFFLSLLWSCTSQSEKAKPRLQSITFIDLAEADSATEVNKSYGARRLVNFDLTNDSVSIYTKAYSYGMRNYGYDRFYKDTVISNSNIDTVLTLFVQWATSFDFQKYYKVEADIKLKAEPCLCNYNYYFIKIKTDSAEKVIALNTRLKYHPIDRIRELLFDITEPTKLKSTTKKLNEDSLLGPLLNLPGFLYVLPRPMPPPDLPPSTPPKEKR